MQNPAGVTQLTNLTKRHPFFTYHLVPLLGYTLLTLLFTWPVAANFTTHIPGQGDAPWFLWQFWWFKHALLDLRQLPYITDLIFYPLTDVPVMAQTPVNEIFTIPLQIAFNLVILNNLLFFLSYIFSGYFTYLLGYTLVRRRDLAFLGGLFFAFCAYRGMRGWGHMSLLTTQWMPLALLLGYQLWHRPTWQRGLALGIVTALVALSSPYYIALFLLPVGGAAAIDLASRRFRALWRRALWRALAVAGTVILIVVVAAYLHYLYLDEEIYTMTRTLGTQVATYSADLLSWLLPPGMNPFWGGYTGPIYAQFTTPNLMETTVFVGYLPLSALILSCVLRRLPSSTRFWQLLAIISLLMSLGPTLHIAGVAYFDWLPYRFLMAIPGFESFRIPSRAGITTALALSILTILVLDRLSRQFPQRVRPLGVSVLAVLFLLNNLPSFPHPLTDARIPAIYETIAANSRGGALLELPAGEFFANDYNFFAEVGKAMYYQSEHQQPLISGYLGRRPSRLHQPERTLPFVRRFFNDFPQQSAVAFPDLSGIPEPFWAADIAQGAGLLTQAGIGTVVLHCLGPSIQPFCQRAIPLLNHTLGLPTEISAGTRLYLVQPPAYQQQRAPHDLTNLALHYDPAFSRLTTDRFGRAYVIKGNGTIHFAVPIPGTWQIQGELVGTELDAVTLKLDQKALDLTHDTYAKSVKSWETTIILKAGYHELSVELPVTAQAAQDGRCTQHCLRNLAIRLVQPQLPTVEGALTTLVDSDNHQATLLAARLLRTERTADPALQSGWLMTSWQLDDGLFAQLKQTPDRLPALFMHLTDANGTIQAQVDHQLGERHLRVAAAGILYDFVPLPLVAAAIDPLELRLGLWYPETGAYYWSTTGTNIDEANRFRAGALTAAESPLLLPDFPIDPRHRATFISPMAAEATPTAGTALTLLSAQIITASADATTPQLLTTWRIPYNFNTRNNAELSVQLTDLHGKLLHQLNQPLGTNNRIDVESEFVIDVVNLPPRTVPAAEVTIQLRLWHPAQAQWYEVINAQGTAVDTHPVALGSWQELTQLSVQP